MVIEYKNKIYLFVHIGGNAGTSIAWYLWTLLNPCEYKPKYYNDGSYKYIDIIRDKEFLKSIGEEQHKTFGEYIEDGVKYDYSFAIIRNPFERILAKFFASPQSKNANAGNVKEIFAGFVDEIYNYKTEFAKEQAMHTCCQSNYIFHAYKEIDFILKFENLQNDFNAFCKITGLPQKKLIKCNSTFHPLKSMLIYNDSSFMRVNINNKFIKDCYYK